MNRSALITGITGQDGSYLAELLLEKGYDVYGLIRRKSQQESELGNVDHLESQIEFLYGDLTDSCSINSAMSKVKPNEVYNLAGQSQVRISFDVPDYTFKVNANGVLCFLEYIRLNSSDTRFYQAGTSEMFGNKPGKNVFNEDSLMHPVSPYGTSKLAAHLLVQNYRNAYGLFAVNGILFNHESPRRGTAFVTQKIVHGATEIQMGKREYLELGNLDVYRDWGHAEDYVKAMWMMLQAPDPEDFVVATGRAAKLEYVIDFVFERLQMDWHLYIRQNPKFQRPSDVSYLRGDPTKIKTKLGWEPEYTLESLLDDMIFGAKRKLDGSIYRDNRRIKA